MEKNVATTAVGMLLCILVHSQAQEFRLSHSETGSKRFEIFSKTAQVKSPYTFNEQGTLYETENDNLLYTTSVKGGKLNGSWQSWYQNGLLCDSGVFAKNLPDGEWKHWNEKGQLVAIRNFSAAKFHKVMDEIVRYNPKRNFYYISTLFQLNKQAALELLHRSNSFPVNNNQTKYSSLKELVVVNVSGLDNYKPVFEQGLLDGEYINYFDNGSIKDSGYYKNGLRHGKWIHRDTMGAIWQQGAYNNGSKIKEWKVYTYNNKLVELIFYNNSGKERWRKKMKR